VNSTATSVSRLNLNITFIPLNPEDIGNRFIRNVGKYPPDYTVAHPRRQELSEAAILNTKKSLKILS
jgi:hypothetical protein